MNPYISSHGFETRLRCPVCEDFCETIEPEGYDDGVHGKLTVPYWTEEQFGQCHCGAKLTVYIDNYADCYAELREIDEDEVVVPSQQIKSQKLEGCRRIMRFTEECDGYNKQED
jgi:hypothetical protein